MKELIEYIEKSVSLSDDIICDLKSIITERNVEKGDNSSKNSNRKIQIFVASGCLRAFYTSESAKSIPYNLLLRIGGLVII